MPTKQIKHFTTRPREIIFKGKTLTAGRWIMGYYKQLPPYYNPNEVRDCILEFGNDVWVKVHPDTVVQYIGVEDSKGEMLFEGDIVRVVRVSDYTGVESQDLGLGVICLSCNKSYYCGVTYHIVMNDDLGSRTFCPSYKITKVGNIFDNPELTENVVLKWEF